MRNIFWGITLAIAIAGRVWAEPAHPLDLKPFVGKSSTVGVYLIFPHGQQVLDGIPFQIDGPIYFYSTNVAQKSLPGITNLTLKTAGKFDKIHLLATTDSDGPDGAEIANLRLHYTDGSEKTLKLIYGEDLRSWFAPLHKPEDPLKNPGAHMAWHSLYSGAQSDKYARFFHIALTNPTPEKELASIVMECPPTEWAFLLFAVTVAPQNPDVVPDTIVPTSNPFPDLRPRKGEPVQSEGFILRTDGKPIPHAFVRITGVHDFNTEDNTSTTKDPAVGLVVETDELGHFVLPPLPDNKLYRLLAWASNYDSSTYRGVDPKSDPVELRLKELSKSSMKQLHFAKGRILGSDGKPVPFAVIEQQGVDNGNGMSWGGPQDFPSQVIGNSNGEFTLGRNQDFKRVQVKINALNLAQLAVWLDATNTLQEIQMDTGAQLHGRVLKDRKPLADMRVGVVGAQRSMEVFVGTFEEKTDTNGEFLFEHLPANTQWQFDGKMESFKPYGALPPRPVSTGNVGGKTDLGDLPVVPAIHLAGRVKTRNGEPLPEGLKLYVGYDDAWDTQTLTVNKDGQFRVEGLSRRTVTISLQNRSWRLVAENRSMDVLNPYRLIGQLEGDKDDLLLLIEKGGMRYNRYSSANGWLPPTDQPNSHPLWGAEDSGPAYIVLAGRVLDDKTSQSITNFDVTPGYKPPAMAMPRGARPGQKPLLNQMLQPFAKKPSVPYNERIYWQYSGTQSNLNGAFYMRFIPISSQPVLRVEAPGYEPVETDPTNSTTTNLVLRLKRGVGPNGVVFQPDGKPALHASIVYAIDREQFSLIGTSFNTNMMTAYRVTGADGKFAFEPRAEANMLFVSHPSGWAEYPLADYSGKNVTIELNSWAAVKGQLVGSNNVPMAGVTLYLDRFNDWQRGGANVNLQQTTITDAQGNFLFTNVPPTRVDVTRRTPFGPRGTGWTTQTQSWLFVKPGITNDLGNVTYDQPPPAPAMERLKQTLGL
jgi:hypothetical protein